MFRQEVTLLVSLLAVSRVPERIGVLSAPASLMPPPVGASRRRPPPDLCSPSLARWLRADGGRWDMPICGVSFGIGALWLEFESELE